MDFTCADCFLLSFSPVAAAVAAVRTMIARDIVRYQTAAPLAIVGPYCSTTAPAIHAPLAAAGIPIVSYGASSSLLASAVAYVYAQQPYDHIAYGHEFIQKQYCLSIFYNSILIFLL